MNRFQRNSFRDDLACGIAREPGRRRLCVFAHLQRALYPRVVQLTRVENAGRLSGDPGESLVPLVMLKVLNLC